MHRLIQAGVQNPVATNLMMLVIIVTGGWSAFSLSREATPQVAIDVIQVNMVFDGAAPEAVEESIIVRIEEAIRGIEGIRRLVSTAYEGRGVVNAELNPAADNRTVKDEIEAAVEKIDTFPDDAKKPRILELVQRQQVVNIAVYGLQPERTLKEVAQRVRDDLLSLPTISQVRILGTRDYEIVIEMTPAALRRYGLTLAQVRDIIQQSSLDLPAGELKTPAQDIVIRTAGQRYTAAEFAALPLLTTAEGAIITLGQIAHVIDGFAEAEHVGRFNGQPGVLVSVFKTDAEDALVISEAVRSYVVEQNRQLSEGLRLSVWADTAPFIRGRLQLLTHNGLIGLLLVFLCLWAFLNFRLAFWVVVGLSVALMGAFSLLDMSGNTLNMITMFAFIMALGMLVDDAIVVGENIYRHWRQGKHPVQAAIDGAAEIALPVIATVATSMAAFLPLFLMEGVLGKFIAVIPLTIVAALVASLLECLIMMPSHLAHTLPERQRLPSGWFQRQAQRLRQGIDASLDGCITHLYLPVLRWTLTFRVVVVAGAMAMMMLALGLILGGHINFFLLPKTDADIVVARLTLPQGTPADRTLDMMARLEQAAWQVNKRFPLPSGDAVVLSVMTVVGTQTNPNPEAGSHAGEIILELLPAERRDLPSTAILSAWRDLTGDIPDALALTFDAMGVDPGGPPIEIRFSGHDFARLQQVADRLKTELATYPGVFDIQDSFRLGKMELRLVLKPEARVLGLTLSDLARQVRHGFYGAEVLRLQRGRDDVRVMVRYPAVERRALGDIERMRIRTPDGRDIPFAEVASVAQHRGYAVIQHHDRRRVVTVAADVDTSIANAAKIVSDLQTEFLPQLLSTVDSVQASFEGQHRETQRSVTSLYRGFVLALVLIYGILATLFRSYAQPLLVMAVIPFGLISALAGHLLMGEDLTMLSLFGLVALSGVVVNDALILLDFINRAVRSGMPLKTAILAGGQSRFRPILLTTVTTAAGLLPILLEKSFQAQFLIPMAISISFGLLGATAIVLVLIPALYMLLHDVDWLLYGLWSGSWSQPMTHDVGVAEETVNPEGLAECRVSASQSHASTTRLTS